jgi:glycosyltransferase involved in cell wall biosynthesis
VEPARILFVHPGEELGSFVAQDLALLRRHFEVTTLPWTRASDAARIRRALRTHDAVFTWFLSHHAAACAAAARLAGKPSLAVAGGQEVTAPQALGQRAWGLKDKAATTFAANHTDLVLAVSRFTAQEALRLRHRRGRSEVRVVHNGVDTARFRPGSEAARGRRVACVSTVSEAYIALKRLDLLAAAARLLPDVEFVLAGPIADRAARAFVAGAPPNVAFPGAVPYGAMPALLASARVVAQPSVYESFGMANAEGMASGCVPVVTPVSALPEVVGSAGLYLDDPPTAEGFAATLEEALASPLGRRARQRVCERFGLERRAEALATAVHDAVYRRLHPTATVADLASPQAAVKALTAGA